MSSKKLLKTILLQLALLGTGIFVDAKVTLPKLVSDGMVLQRDHKVKIWGNADISENIIIQFQNKKYKTKANNQGYWEIHLPKMKAGGPFKMTINEISLNDILIGDVWLASGQSNMELPMRRVKTVYGDELNNANNTNIRFFTVPQKYNFKKAEVDLSDGKWESTNKETIKEFSAAAYFFAQQINQKYNIPVGIIHSSLGGSPIQSWMDAASLKKYPESLEEAEKWKNDALIKETESKEQSLSQAWYSELNQSDIGLHQNWKDEKHDDSDWKKINIPGSWEDLEGSFDGSVWFRKEINLTAGNENDSAFLNLGRIKDADETYINGVKVGNVTYEYPPRWYTIPKGVLKKGKNVIIVRVINGSGKGEFISDKPYYLEIGNQKIQLTGEWKYKVAAKMDRLAPGQTFIRWKPTGLYNAMIHPVTNYNIKGALWYQGESNTGKPKEYYDLLSTMIQDWRNKWQQPDMPFLIVQLTNFMEPKKQPLESNWAELRNQQRKITETIPNTGLAVTIDIGEWNDIHPLNKKEVGVRLALQADKLAYNPKVIADGPLYESMKIEGNKIILSFKKGTADFQSVDELKEFAIEDQNGKYHWAKAKINGNTIEVWNDEITNPISVRYAWADNPENANLKNKSGLPASPFTTK